MITSEADIQDTIQDYLVLTGWLVMRINGGRASRSLAYYRWTAGTMGSKTTGVADLLAWRDGVCLAVECKAPGGKVNSSQVMCLGEAAARGMMAVVAHSLADVQAAILEDVRR